MRFGKSFAHDDLDVAAQIGRAAQARKEQVELLGAILGQRKHHPVRRLGKPREVERDSSRHARLHGRHSRDFCQARAQRIRRPFQLAEEIGKSPVGIKVRALRDEGMHHAARGKHHRDAACHHQADGDDLVSDFREVAKQLQVERGKHHLPN